MKCKICGKELYCCEYLDKDNLWVVVVGDATTRRSLWEEASKKLQIPIKIIDDGIKQIGEGSPTPFIKIAIPKAYINKKEEFKRAANYYTF